MGLEILSQASGYSKVSIPCTEYPMEYAHFCNTLRTSSLCKDNKSCMPALLFASAQSKITVIRRTFDRGVIQ